MHDIIRLNNLELMATHGCYKTEKLHPQKFVVTIICESEIHFDESDELHHTINYENIRSIVLRIFEGEPVNLIETLANRIAKEVLQLKLVKSVEISIRKPEIWKDSVPELIMKRTK